MVSSIEFLVGDSNCTFLRESRFFCQQPFQNLPRKYCPDSCAGGSDRTQHGSSTYRQGLLCRILFFTLNVQRRSGFRPLCQEPSHFLQIRLDFAGIGSVCGAMANGSTYDFGAAFAPLTCVLEDATVQAVEGQSGLINETSRKGIVIELEQRIAGASRLLKEIKTALK